MKYRSLVERGFVQNGDLGTLKKFTEDHAMAKLIKKHNNIEDSFHLGSFDMFVVSAKYEEDSTDSAIFYLCTFMLSTVFRVIESGWPLNNCVDLFHRFCTADVKMIGFGAMVLGGKNYPLLLGTIPDKHGESKQMYHSSWQVMCVTLRRFVRDWKPCGDPQCQTCTETKSALSGRRVRSWISTKNFIEKGELPLRGILSDNSGGLLKLVQEDVDFADVIFLICSAHLTGKSCIFV